MKCRNCKRIIEDNSLFCNWCGEKQIVERKRKKAGTYIPKPRRLDSGNWFIQLRLDGESVSVTESSEAKCIAKARAIKDGFVERTKKRVGMTIGQAIDAYILDNSSILSPSTIRGYATIRRTRFRGLMDIDVAADVNWQRAVNQEAELVSPKTVANSWRLITASLLAQNINPPSVKLPKMPKAERPWLDYEQILLFLDAVRDKPCELAALLALHSLRRSELMALTSDKIDFKRDLIFVSGAAVYNSDSELVYKASNKTVDSQRYVPIVIPRLKELLVGAEGKLITCNPNTLYTQINRVCEQNSLPLVGVHGLRHSFASLAYHLKWSEATTMTVGGWSDSKVVHNIYTHLASQDKNEDVERMRDFYQNGNKC